MAKAHGGGEPARRKKKIRLWQILLALIVVAGLVSSRVLRNQGLSSSDDKASTSDKPPDPLAGIPALRDRLVLPAAPQKPRPFTLDPAAYTEPETKQAYQAAKDIPEVLEHVACYCGCFGTAGHRNNLDCFRDNHGVT